VSESHGIGIGQALEPNSPRRLSQPATELAEHWQGRIHAVQAAPEFARAGVSPDAWLTSCTCSQPSVDPASDGTALSVGTAAIMVAGSAGNLTLVSSCREKTRARASASCKG
jgi:hypothetical protein